MSKKAVFSVPLILVVGLLGCASAEPNLVAYYDFETGSGDIAYDESGYGTTADGTIYGDTAWTDVSGSGVASLGNYALYFDDNDDVVKCGDPAKVKNITGAITVAAWVKIDTFTKKWQTVVSKYHSWWIRRGTGSESPYPGTDDIDWWVGTNTSSATTHAGNIQDSTWHHLAGTYDSATGEMYVYTDGLLSDSADLTGSIKPCDDELYIGADTTGITNEWKGLIDEVRIYDRALSAFEIAELVGLDNFPPVVDAGSNQSIEWPNNTVIMDANVSDDGEPDPPNSVTLTWSKVSGPNDVTFEPNEFVEDPNAVFCEPGVYVLRLTADDSELTSSDSVTITVYAEGYYGLVVYYDFESGSGSTAYDRSGFALDGTLSGDPQWITGKIGNYAMKFDGIDEQVDCGSDSKLNLTDDFTITAWMKTTEESPGYFFQRAQGSPTWECYTLAVLDDKLFSRSHDGTTQGDVKSTADVNDGKWHHVALVADAGQPLTLYIDGSVVTQYDTRQNAPAGPYNFTADKHLYVGYSTSHGSFTGSLDEVRLYSRALSPGEIANLPFGDPALAHDRNPLGNEPVSPAVVLSWAPGVYASSHDVYLGTDFNSVKDASRQTGDLDGSCKVDWADLSVLTGQWLDSNGSVLSADLDDDGDVDLIDFTVMAGEWMEKVDAVFKGNQDSNSYEPPETLEFDTAYHWRIDEVNDTHPNSPWKGHIWSFTTNRGAAWDPSPANDTIAPNDVILSWLPGVDANSHDVYLGTDYNNVRDANSNNPLGVYKGPNDVVGPDGNNRFSYDPPGALELNTTYHWRIDEVNDSGLPQWPGDIWTFDVLAQPFDDGYVREYQALCEPTHLQGITTDKTDAIYWSFSCEIVKTDLEGNTLKSIFTAPEGHYGDLTYHDGKIYVAVNFGAFNQESGADSWVYVYDANDLSLLSTHEVQELVHGAGGMAYHDGRFIIVGGLPGGYTENYAYEYDTNFQFIQRHTIPSGYTLLGIQTVCYHNGYWWYGCCPVSGWEFSDYVLLKTDESFQLVGKYYYYCTEGINGLSGDKFLIGRITSPRHRGKVFVADLSDLPQI